MRTCTACGILFPATAKNYRCLPCRRIYNEAWRAKRRAEGKPSSGARMPREWHREYEKEYFKNPEKREQRNAKMRDYTKSPITRPHHKARWAVHRALVAGKIVRQPCEVCGALPSEAHHEDYSRALAVRWLCKPHHVEAHAKAEGGAS